MFKQMAEILHKAQNELEIGLDKLDEKQIKNTYNDLVALQIDIHPTIQRLKPVFGDAGEFGLGRSAVHSRAFSVDPEGHEKADNDQNQI